MNSSLETSIIIPCLNEQDNIEKVVERIENVLDESSISAEILLIDDNSTDDTLRVSKMLEQTHQRVRALHKGMPRGLGSAVRFGIDNAFGKMGVVVMGDGVDPLFTIPEFKEKIIDEGYHLVLLSRYTELKDSDTIPFSYKFFHWWYRLLAFILVGISFKDTTYAYRAFDLDYIRGLDLKSGGFEISPEITFKTFITGGRITEVPGMQTRRVQGASKFLFHRAGYGYARVLITSLFLRCKRLFVG